VEKTLGLQLGRGEREREREIERERRRGSGRERWSSREKKRKRGETEENKGRIEGRVVKNSSSSRIWEVKEKSRRKRKKRRGREKWRTTMGMTREEEKGKKSMMTRVSGTVWSASMTVLPCCPKWKTVRRGIERC
jgi:hypothetical protein